MEGLVSLNMIFCNVSPNVVEADGGALMWMVLIKGLEGSVESIRIWISL
jgi:hypothetical protein